MMDLSGAGYYHPSLYEMLDGVSLRRAIYRPMAVFAPREYALTQMSKCFIPVDLESPRSKLFFAARQCPGSPRKWNMLVDKRRGPAKALMGYAVRSEHWRYIAWHTYDSYYDDVDWSLRPYVEELYDHRPGTFATSRMDTDFDRWDRDNLLWPGAKVAPNRRNVTSVREIADRHLAMLRAGLRSRRERGGWLERRHRPKRGLPEALPPVEAQPTPPPDDW